MKKLAGALLIAFSAVSCQENVTVSEEFTGNESTYALQAGSSYPISGTVTFKEKLNGAALIVVKLNGTEGNIKHPVHLHIGNISTPDAEIAALLNPVTGKTGSSETLLSTLADESTITYQQLIALNACIKIHLAEAGPDKNIVLAGGNIGAAAADDASSGRTGMRVCKSE